MGLGLSPGTKRTCSGSSHWLLCLASIFPPFGKFLGHGWQHYCRFCSLVISPRCPCKEFFIRCTQGWEERTWGSFVMTEMGVTEGRGQEPTSWLIAEEKQMGWEIVAWSIVTTMVLFLIFSCVISFGSLGYNILKSRDGVTWLFLAYSIPSWSLATRKLVSVPVSSLGCYLNVTQDPPRS